MFLDEEQIVFIRSWPLCQNCAGCFIWQLSVLVAGNIILILFVISNLQSFGEILRPSPISHFYPYTLALGSELPRGSG